MKQPEQRTAGARFPASELPAIDFAIADYGTPELAQQCLRSIKQTLLPANWPYTAMIRDAKMLDESFAQAINRTLRMGSSPIVCALNADTRMLEPPRIVAQLFDEDSNIAIIGPRQVNDAHLFTHAGIFGTNKEPDQRRYQDKMDENTDWETAERVRDAIFVPGAVLFCRREVWEELGGLLETEHYYEDTALCYLARHRGYRVVYTGATTWIHHGDQSLPTTVRDQQGVRNANRKRLAWIRSWLEFNDFCKRHGIEC